MHHFLLLASTIASAAVLKWSFANFLRFSAPNFFTISTACPRTLEPAPMPSSSPHSDESMRLPGQKEPVGVQEASVVWLWVDMIVGSMGSQMIGTEGSTFSTMMGMMADPVYKSVSRFGNRCEKRGLYFPK